METKLELAKKVLFSDGGLSVADVKLFPGSSRDATPEAMAEQVVKAIAQIESGEFELIETFED